MKTVKLFFISTLVLIMGSCSVIGLNMSNKTPKRAHKFPTFTEKDSLQGFLSSYRSCYDVTFYDIHLDINIEKKSIAGFVDISFDAVEKIDTLQIDLHQNFKIEGIVLGRDTLSYYRKHKAVFVVLKSTLPKGDKGVLRVHYAGKPMIAKRPPWEGGFVWKKDGDKNPWVGVACQGLGASTWLPVKDHLSDEPDSVQMSFTIPEGLFCVSNGRLVEHSNVDGKEKFVWKTSYSINTYNITFYIGNFFHFNLPYENKGATHLLDFYVLAYNVDVAKFHFRQVGDVLKFYENTIGPYPWWKDGYKIVESPYLGMEHQTAIAYGSSYRNDFSDVDYIILHETGHEWWGNCLSVGDVADIWLHEGITTYCDALYSEQTKGYDRYLLMMKYQYALTVKNKKPVVGPFGVNYWPKNDSDPYVKGALILHTLRNTINDDQLFFDILRTFYARYQYSIVTSQNFIDIVNEKTKKDFQWFFDQYLYNRVCPELEWNSEYNEQTNELTIKYRWTNVGKSFKLPIEITTGNGKRIINPSDEVQTIKVRYSATLNFNQNFSYIAIKNNKKL